jgi:hypothetical protein
MDAQRPLVELAKRIRQASDQNALRGYAGAELDLDANRVILYWQGQVPTGLTRLPRGGVNLEVRRAPYSLATLDAESRRLSAAYKGVVQINSIGPLRDYSGLAVKVDPSIGANRARQLLKSSVPLTITERPAATPLYDRWADAPPFWGGAVITSSVATCSTGFAVTRSGTSAMMTSRHCGMNVDWRTPIDSRFVGRTTIGDATRDSALLTGSSYDPYIYIGDYRSTTGDNVSGWHYPFVGEHVCMGGGLTGEVCGNRVDEIQVYVQNGTVGPGYWTIQVSQLAAAGNGDSGGPSYTRDSLGIHATGIITLGTLTSLVPCIGYTGGGRKCYYEIFSTNVGNNLSTLGAQLKTTS